MSLTAAPPAIESLNRSVQPDCAAMEDASTFGLQGLTRDALTILKPDCVNRLAATLALRGTREEIQDPAYVQRVLSRHPDWVEEYQVVHLIERSLWLQGHSDLVMTMTKNPSQIPDNPPDKVMDALSRAYTQHPDATVWYGVPLFSAENNADGLPIPVTPAEVRSEAQKRIETAQEHALNWGWLYRAAVSTAMVPARCWNFGVRMKQGLQYSANRVIGYWNQARRDARRRARAIVMAEHERCRFGDSTIEIPQHQTWLGRSMESTYLFLELVAYQASLVGAIAPSLSFIAAPLIVAQYVPVLFIPLTIVSVDPFLFVELPQEQGRLRHIGHWYWQKQTEGQDKLHLHV
ncbi:hypothetical protein [Schlesneria paludicola]|uniref:hypothetical protein n=1 Tax=Schlesneria paludicola TaxID=360056 RepID=UPI00029A11D4|nr:hypothetical protein [Schlesneria paludicola]